MGWRWGWRLGWRHWWGPRWHRHWWRHWWPYHPPWWAIGPREELSFLRSYREALLRELKYVEELIKELEGRESK